MVEIDDRKFKILQAVVRNYLETGEPVGSRTISKYTDLNLSSATIRNEMADLEELGYILQPHTSAGRIPSDKGYRLYVDHMMAEKEQEVNEMKELLLDAETLYTREQLHDVLTKVCGFPSDYGRNLDALYDLLTAYPAARLTLRHPEMLVAHLGNYGELVLRVLADAATENPAFTLNVQ